MSDGQKFNKLTNLLIEALKNISHNAEVASHPLRPPIGVMPRWRWLELRAEGLAAALTRYKEAGNPNPELTYKWTVEMLQLERELSKMPEHESCDK